MASVGDFDSKRDLNSLRFSYQHHARKLLSNLNETRKIPDLCDAYITIDGTCIPVQKSVLSAASQYLRALFSYNKNQQQHDGKMCINLDSLNVGAKTFERILDYIYTAQVLLEPENIQDLLQAADLLLLTDLKDTCCEFLQGCISPHNCIGIREFTARLSCPWIHLRVTQYLDEHFREATYSEEFLRLPADEVHALLIRDTIQVRVEEDVMDSIIRWYRWDMVSRKAQMSWLLNKCIRVGFLSDQAISRLRQDDANPDALEEVAQVLDALRQDPRQDRRRGLQQVLVVCGGEGQAVESQEEIEAKATTRCVRINKSQSSPNCVWIDLAPMLTPRTGHCVVEVGGFLYAVGGRDQHCRILNTGEKYNPNTNTWTAIAPMEHGRVGFGLVAIDDSIYALGGSNDMTDPLTSMEVYNVFTNKWRPLPDMVLKRVWSAFAAADKKIYVIAGGIVGKFYEAVECFDTRTESWLSVSPLRERRCDARAVAVENDIYVFGGFRHIECPGAVQSGHSLKFCGTEVYMSKNDYWVSVQNRHGAPGLCIMNERSHICGAVYDGEDVLVVGELDVGNSVHCVRAFNRHTNTWQCLVQNLPTHQQRYQCCLLSIPLAVLAELYPRREDAASTK
ncbi:hypothetical protein C0Q70_18544 [Pomacea canaliculata]|uniref:BTB domain-containing protein n=2 Tax=Pomacea canaliculata TaxID=400727 RepID=A0A2T7NGU2_POMCA|nr:gigaxonin-like isoform X2 [Pomacea canaliculata]PVD20390.1 hypothetical protein C0Q70_18544 [Pomacea canaliculata]